MGKYPPGMISEDDGVEAACFVWELDEEELDLGFVLPLLGDLEYL
jgi:hypothetical protein